MYKSWTTNNFSLSQTILLQSLILPLCVEFIALSKHKNTPVRSSGSSELHSRDVYDYYTDSSRSCWMGAYLRTALTCDLRMSTDIYSNYTTCVGCPGRIGCGELRPASYQERWILPYVHTVLDNMKRGDCAAMTMRIEKKETAQNNNEWKWGKRIKETIIAQVLNQYLPARERYAVIDRNAEIVVEVAFCVFSRPSLFYTTRLAISRTMSCAL